MAEPIRLPPFGEGVAEAELVAWLVEPGDEVRSGDDIAEVQTVKAALTVAAPCDGVLSRQDITPGTTVEVGQVIGQIEAADGAAVAEQGEQAEQDGSSDETVRPRRVPSVSNSVPVVISRLLVPVSDPTGARQGRELGWTAADLAALASSGRGGRVTSADIGRELTYSSCEQEPAGPRQAIADTMRRSDPALATVAHDIDLDALLKHRRTVEGRPNLTVYGVKALAIALADDDRGLASARPNPSVPKVAASPSPSTRQLVWLPQPFLTQLTCR